MSIGVIVRKPADLSSTDWHDTLNKACPDYLCRDGETALVIFLVNRDGVLFMLGHDVVLASDDPEKIGKMRRNYEALTWP